MDPLTDEAPPVDRHEVRNLPLQIIHVALRLLRIIIMHSGIINLYVYPEDH